MKTLYESLFDQEEIISNITDKTKIIGWFVDHDINMNSFEYWEKNIRFNRNGSIDIETPDLTFSLNYDGELPNYININHLNCNMVANITKADKLTLKGFPKSISAGVAITIVCEDTTELILPDIKIVPRSFSSILIYSDKLKSFKSMCKTHPNQYSFFCYNLSNVHFVYNGDFIINCSTKVFDRHIMKYPDKKFHIIKRDRLKNKPNY